MLGGVAAIDLLSGIDSSGCLRNILAATVPHRHILMDDLSLFVSLARVALDPAGRLVRSSILEAYSSPIVPLLQGSSSFMRRSVISRFDC